MNKKDVNYWLENLWGFYLKSMNSEEAVFYAVDNGIPVKITVKENFYKKDKIDFIEYVDVIQKAGQEVTPETTKDDIKRITNYLFDKLQVISNV